MKQFDILEQKQEDGALIFVLGGNHNVMKVAGAADGAGEVLVKYAQNGIIDELVYFGTATLKEAGAFTIEMDLPVEASHIYVFPGSGLGVSDVSVFEREEVDPGLCYPKHFDFDLTENYFLDTVTVVTPAEGFCHYSLYTSLDGQNFDLAAEKQNNEPCNEGGDLFNLAGKEARIIRVYLEYNSISVEASLLDMQFSGEKSGRALQEPKTLQIPAFADSEFNVPVTERDTIDEVFGIISRRLGEEFKPWFSFSLAPNPKGSELDYFRLSAEGGKVKIQGNNGVSLATGLNHYLKYFCQVNISQVGDQVTMPPAVILPESPVFRETKAKIRYSYNYCTLSYAMAFWGEHEWRQELDWLALNGVNVVLDATAQEEVWRRFLGGLGYSHKEVKDFVAGPAYYAWAYMANLYGFGGPVHDSWFSERTELARRNQLIMRKLGMKPVLQGYSGMVPVDILGHDENAEIIPQGTWCSFRRPAMLKTTAPVFRDYAKRFYAAQKEVYGDEGIYFATDPFHEGGNTGGLSERVIAKEVLSAMLEAEPKAVWMIQSWQTNPASELLAGLSDVEQGKEHALILDLYAEKNPHHHEGKPGNPNHGYTDEFDKTPWLFCMLNNFGGRLGLHGHLDNLAKNIPFAFNNREKIAGIGITPEASVNNPVLYDFLFDCVWQEDGASEMPTIDLSSWLSDYARRRYGAESESAKAAWEIFKDTVYKAELNILGQGAPECVFDARPTLEVKTASTWGNAVICYDKKDLEQAARLLLSDYDALKDSPGYLYDVATVLLQVLSNQVQDCYDALVAAYHAKDSAAFGEKAEELLSLSDKMEAVTGSSGYYMLGTWVERAKALAQNADDFTRKLYQMNAKSLITTWGSYNQSEIGKLHDYSNRQWSGLIGDFYKKRWEMWLDARKKELAGEAFPEKIDWFAWEWAWVRSDKRYPNQPKAVDFEKLGKEILK